MAYDPNIAKQIAASVAIVEKALGAVVKSVPGSLEDFGNEFVNQMKSSLSHEGSGVQYPGQPNRSSAPGEAPAAQTKKYLESWDFVVGQESATVYYVDVGSPENYGGELEYGNSKMEPRPHVRPQVDRMKGQLSVRVAKDVSGSENKELKSKATELIDLLIGGGE